MTVSSHHPRDRARRPVSSLAPENQRSGGIDGASGVAGSFFDGIGPRKQVRVPRRAVTELLERQPGMTTEDIERALGIGCRGYVCKRLLTLEREGWVRRGLNVPRDNRRGGPDTTATWWLPLDRSVDRVEEMEWRRTVNVVPAPQRDPLVSAAIRQLPPLAAAWGGHGFGSPHGQAPEPPASVRQRTEFDGEQREAA